MRPQIGGVRLHVSVLGDEWHDGDHRPVIVALHGGPGVDGSGVRFLMRPAAEYAQVLVPDQRGHGHSDLSEPSRWNLDTMKTLYLLRHAKSSWADGGIGDLDRPLAPRGQRAAEKIANHLRQQGIAPVIVLCSSARRARETLAVVAPAFGSATEHVVEDGLYAASAADLLNRLQRIPDRTASAMIIGHNPGLQDLAVTLVGHGPWLQRLREGFPTTALAVLRSPTASWGELGPGGAKLIDFVVPRQL
jgi:phosphohistidine phosphatase